MKKRIAALLLIVSMLFCTSYAAEFQPQIDTDDANTMLEFYKAALRYTAKNYEFGTTYDELLDHALLEYFKQNPEAFDQLMQNTYSMLDENSHYFSADKFAQVEEDTNGQFVGIGVQIGQVNNNFYISEPFQDSPAQKAGLKANDVILAVDGEDVAGLTLDALVNKVRGVPGTTVAITVKRGEETIVCTAVRDTILVNPVEYKVLGKNNAGYVKLVSFNGNAHDYVAKALDELAKQGVDKVILDLRNNLGGYLSEAVGIASHFVPDGKLVVTEKQSQKDITTEYKSDKTDQKFKVVVLVNEYSASASEIVSGAVKYYSDGESGVLVGNTTFGKGTVQTYMQLKNGGAMWLTIGQYYLPDGSNIHKKGIEPTYRVKNTTETYDLSSFEPVNGERILQFGDSGKDVLALKQRLDIWGFHFTNLDENYDSELVDAVASFQKSTELFSYGVADLTTQLKLIEQSRTWEKTVDKQLEYAEDLIYKMK